MGSNSVSLWLSAVAAALAVLYAVSSNHTYVFDKVELQQIARDAIRVHNSSHAIVKAVVTELQRRHPKHVAQGDYDSLEWLFNNAGGAMGSMTVLHASFSEYVIIFGTALG
jgi:C-8 sterol isomerase